MIIPVPGEEDWRPVQLLGPLNQLRWIPFTLTRYCGGYCDCDGGRKARGGRPVPEEDAASVTTTIIDI